MDHGTFEAKGGATDRDVLPVALADRKAFDCQFGRLAFVTEPDVQAVDGENRMREAAQVELQGPRSGKL